MDNFKNDSIVFEEGFSLRNNKYDVKTLTLADETRIQRLCERCLDYFLLVDGGKPEKGEGHSILSALPLNKELKDKFVLGTFNENGVLVALVDLIKDYKEVGQWTLGLFIIDPEARGQKLGENLHQTIKNSLIKFGASSIRIGVVEENFRGHSFWVKLGYKEIERVEMKFKNKEHIVIIMTYSL